MKRRNSTYSLLSGLFTAILTGSAWGAQAPAGAAIVNTAFVSYDGGAGTVVTLPTDTVVTEVMAGALEVVKTASRPSVSAGDTLAYEITARNAGTAPLTRVTITDSLPVMLSHVSSVPAGTVRGNAVEWVIPSIDPGASVTLRLHCRVLKSDYSETIINRVSYSADGTPAGRSAPVSVRWIPWSEADLSKTVSPRRFYAGDTLAYALTARNTGVTDLTRVAVRDTLPEGLTFLSSDRTVDVDGSVVSWTVDLLPKDGQARLTLLARALSGAAGDTLVNRAVLVSSEAASDTASAAAVSLGTGAGIELTKLARDSVYAAGDTVRYSLVLRGAGVRPLMDVTVTDTLPAELAFLRASHGGVCADSIVTWRFTGLEPDFGDTLRLTAAIAVPLRDGTRIRNEAWARAAFGARDSSAWEIRVTSKPGVLFEKRVDVSECAPGDTLEYRLTASNTGTEILHSITVSDVLPAGLDLVSCDPAADTSGGGLTWTIGSLDYRTSREFRLRARVSATVSGDTIRNTARFTSAETGPVLASAAAAFRNIGSGIKIIKRAEKRTWWAGDTLTYDLILTNGVPAPSATVTILDTLNPRLRFVSATHGGILRDSVMTWTLRNLSPGFHDTLRLTVTVPRPVPDSTFIDNRVWALSSAGAQDSSRWGITVFSPPVLALEITEPRTTFIGDTIRYRLVSSNIGDIPAYNPVLTDTLPEYLEFVGATADWTFDASAGTVAGAAKTGAASGSDPAADGAGRSGSTGAVVWRLPDLFPGDRDTVFLDVRVTDRLGSRTRVDNIAWLTCVHSTGAIRVTDAAVTVLPGNGLWLSKTVDKTAAVPGDTLSYVLHFGVPDRDVTGEIRITDFLPAELALVPESVLLKPSARLVSYDPVTNLLEFVQSGLAAGLPDSIVLKAVVRPGLAPGVLEIENTARAVCDGDTALSADHPRTRARTRIVRSFLDIRKTVNRKTAQGGDVLTYTVTCLNRSADDSLFSLTVYDRLPRGFRYEPGTTRIDSIPGPDPSIAESGGLPLMTWTIERSVPPGGSMQVKYRVRIGLSAGRGELKNLVTASASAAGGVLVVSPEASAAVLVSGGAFDERGLIIGKVYEDLDGNASHDRGEPGVGNIELVLEDGTRVRTDTFGKFSIPDVGEGQHVVRLNEKTLPAGTRVTVSDFNFLDDPKSRLVLVPPGGMAKANFTIEKSR
ncbi:MAG: hypothetical protein QUS35_07590 [bacterium]|nr:hypothetical protein [bacterium]